MSMWITCRVQISSHVKLHISPRRDTILVRDSISISLLASILVEESVAA